MKMNKRVKHLDKYLLLLKEIKLEITYSLNGIVKIITSSENIIAKEIVKHIGFTGDFSLAWKESVGIFDKDEDAELFLSFIKEFGQTDLEMNEKILDNHIERVNMKYLAAKDELKQKGKITIMFSLFISFTAAMLLI